MIMSTMEIRVAAIEIPTAHLLKVFELLAIEFAFSDKELACFEISLASLAIFKVSVSRFLRFFKCDIFFISTNALRCYFIAIIKNC